MWRLFTAGLPENLLQPARDLNQQLDLGHIDYETFTRKIIELTGQSPVEVERLKSSEIVKNGPLISYIGVLKQHYKIGLLSNISSNWIQTSLLTAQEIMLFDDMILSHQVGLIKPDPEIFKLTCRRLGVKPETAVLVDDIQNNCIAARAVGMQAICYQDFAQFKTELNALSSRS